MGDLGSIFNAVNNDLGGGTSAATLASRGYKQFLPSAAPGLNMGAYGPVAANTGTADTFLGNQQDLVKQLAAQATGTGGPNLAQEQMRQGQQGALAGALAAAASSRGNQNPGATQKDLLDTQAAINAGGAGQAGQVAAQQELGAQGAESGALNSFGNQQLALAGQQNAVEEANQQNAQAGNAAQQAQYQYNQNLRAGQQSQENSAISGAPPANVAGAAVTGAANAGAGALSNALSSNSNQGNNGNSGGQSLGGGSTDMGSSGGGGSSPIFGDSAAFGTGGETTSPIVTTVGEDGPEIAKLAPGSEIVPLNHPDTGQGIHPLVGHVRALLQHPDFLSKLKEMVGDQVMSKRMNDLEAALAAKGGVRG